MWKIALSPELKMAARNKALARAQESKNKALEALRVGDDAAKTRHALQGRREWDRFTRLEAAVGGNTADGEYKPVQGYVNPNARHTTVGEVSESMATNAAQRNERNGVKALPGDAPPPPHMGGKPKPTFEAWSRAPKAKPMPQVGPEAGKPPPAAVKPPPFAGSRAPTPNAAVVVSERVRIPRQATHLRSGTFGHMAQRMRKYAPHAVAGAAVLGGLYAASGSSQPSHQKQASAAAIRMRRAGKAAAKAQTEKARRHVAAPASAPRSAPASAPKAAPAPASAPAQSTSAPKPAPAAPHTATGVHQNPAPASNAAPVSLGGLNQGYVPVHEAPHLSTSTVGHAVTEAAQKATKPATFLQRHGRKLGFGAAGVAGAALGYHLMNQGGQDPAQQQPTQ